LVACYSDLYLYLHKLKASPTDLTPK
jgi:hypothetical protein